jgi:hypothetical protein
MIEEYAFKAVREMLKALMGKGLGGILLRFPILSAILQSPQVATKALRH